jgi:hypothetical protein
MYVYWLLDDSDSVCRIWERHFTAGAAKLASAPPPSPASPSAAQHHNVISSRVRCLRVIYHPSIMMARWLTRLVEDSFSAAVSTKSKRQLSLKKTLAPRCGMAAWRHRKPWPASVYFLELSKIFMICVPWVEKCISGLIVCMRLFKHKSDPVEECTQQMNYGIRRQLTARRFHLDANFESLRVKNQHTFQIIYN